MGVYSKDRLFDTGYGYSYYDESETSFDPNFSGIMEYAIALQQSDQMMFESLLQCDFISAMNEQTMSFHEAEDEKEKDNDIKKNKVWEKIKQVFNTVKNAVAKAINNIIVRIMALIKNDKKIYEKYEKYFTLANLEGFKGIDGFKYPLSGDRVQLYESESDAIKAISDGIKELSNATSREQVDNIAAQWEKKILAIENRNDIGKKDRNIYDSGTKDWKPTAEQINQSKNEMKEGRESIKDLKDKAKKTKDDLHKLEKDAKSNLKDAKRDDKGDFEIYKMNTIYRLVSRGARAVIKSNNTFINVASKKLAAFRKAFIICGRYCYNKVANRSDLDDNKATTGSGGERNQEETKTTNESYANLVMSNDSFFIEALGEASDTYVFERLGY